ncbi:iron ABC transporter permease [Methanomicrobium antiquum]|uniref:Iron ABC transporter permease n=1 Tax=Methanomicrobium antiquum TaxID=487686 RepID=A0AAF0FWM3_9EURY|nr:iron ABC transporter permease [Methanomicrobium antiquum]WFN37325.1 iron ABC transporter permease [Methanomicrobium antiquum]
MNLSADETGDSFKRTILLIPLIFGVLILLFTLDLLTGSVNIPLDAFFNIITGGEVKETWQNIFWAWRLPKAITAIFAGGALALAGLLMQTFFRNPLADPYILGISSGASLGVALVMLSAGAAGVGVIFQTFGFIGDLSISVAAICGSFAVLALILAISSKIQSNITILILGIMVAYISSALVTILLQFSDESSMHSYTAWTFGSFSGVTWGQIPVMTVLLMAGFLISLCSVKSLNALLLGEQYAESMGMNFKRTRTIIIANTALMAGAVTAFCGPVGFLGIAVPHLCRALFVTADHRILVPACIIVGGIISLCTDIISHFPGTDIVLPLNAITALFGAPVVIWVIVRGTKFGRGVTT